MWSVTDIQFFINFQQQTRHYRAITKYTHLENIESQSSIASKIWFLNILVCAYHCFLFYALLMSALPAMITFLYFRSSDFDHFCI